MNDTEDFKTEALSDDLKKEAYKKMVPAALEQTIKDVLMFKNLKEDVTTSAEMKSLIHERISGDVMNQVFRMDVDAVDAEKPPAAELSGQQVSEWANSLGYGPTQGAISKSGGGKCWNAGKVQRVKGKVKDKTGGQGFGKGKGERPAGACSHCWDFGHYYRAFRLGPEAAAIAEK